MDRFTSAGKAFERLCRLMAALRAPDGCPWDRQQTLETLRAYLLEETYETLEVLDTQRWEAHCEELGDLLLQIVFQSQISAEESRFDVTDVVERVCDKLLRRHPHVFGDAVADDAAGALRNWESIKASERRSHASRLDGVPATLPALLGALRVSEKAASIGLDWPNAAGVWAKVREELDELEQAQAAGDREAMSEELGDLLFALANLARHLSIDAEGSLRQATQKFGHRFRRVEKQLKAAGCDPLSMSGEELEALWQVAKGTPGPVDEPVDNFADDTDRAFDEDVTPTPSGEER